MHLVTCVATMGLTSMSSCGSTAPWIGVKSKCEFHEFRFFVPTRGTVGVKMMGQEDKQKSRCGQCTSCGWRLRGGAMKPSECGAREEQEEGLPSCGASVFDPRPPPGFCTSLSIPAILEWVWQMLVGRRLCVHAPSH